MNNGSSIGDPPAAARYCVTGDTLINTNHGLISIKNFVNNDFSSPSDKINLSKNITEEKDININIQSIDKINSANKWFNSGKHPVINIKTEYGFEISGSYNHPLLVLSPNYFEDIDKPPTFIWKILNDITTNDYLVINCAPQVSSNINQITEEEAKFLGLFFAIGKVRHRSQGKWEHKFVHSDNKLTSIVIQFFKQLIKQLNITKNKLFIQHLKFPKHPADRILINSKIIWQHLRDNYDLKYALIDRVIPNKILQSSLSIQQIFLSYLFECKCDLALYNDKKVGKKPHFIFTTQSKHFIKQLQIMLLQFGIVSNIYEIPDKRKRTFKLKISGYTSFVNFQKYINFVSDKKRKILDDIIQYMSNFNTIENNNYIFAKVISKEYPYQEEYVYSIKVNSNCHSFTANGFINHNTEAKLTKLAEFSMSGINNDAVDFKPNYSETAKEPVVLPSIFPQILCNPIQGIAVGYTCNFPAHNLTEVCNAIIAYIKNNDITIDELLKILPGPDFYEGAQLINNDEIKKLYETGIGKLTFKAKYHIDDNKIIITELPPEVNREKLVEKINKLCFDDKKIPRVASVKDLSTQSTKIIIELQKTAITDMIVNALFIQTDLTKNCSFIMRAIKDNTPHIFSLKEIISHYVQHRQICILRESKFNLNKLNKKLHLQQGLSAIINNLSDTIHIIENAETDIQAKQDLINKFNIDEDQAEAILEFKLRRLTKLNKTDILNNIKSLKDEINNISSLINNNTLVDQKIIDQLNELKQKFGDARRTEIINDINIQTNTTEQDILLILTNKNTIKVISEDAYNEILKTNVLKEKQEIYKQKIKCNTNDIFLLILENGYYVRLTFNDLLAWNSKINIINIYVLTDELVNDANKYITCITDTGVILKVKVNGFKARIKKTALLFKQEMKIIYSQLIHTDKENVITLFTKKGMIHRFYEQSFKEMNTAGKNGLTTINLKDNDKVIAFNISKYNPTDKVILYTKHEVIKNNEIIKEYIGYKILINELIPIKSRAGRGSSYITFSKKESGKVYNGLIIKETADLTRDFINLDNKGKIKNIKLSRYELGTKISRAVELNYEPSIFNYIK